LKFTIKELIQETLVRLGEYGIPYSDEAVELVFETGNAETGYRHLEQMGGPAVSFFQLEPDTIADNWENFIIFRPKLIEGIYSLGYIEKYPMFSTLSNIAVATAMCRVYYWRQDGPIPSTTEERAEYWKDVYNTDLGEGTIKHYLEANGVYVD